MFSEETKNVFRYNNGLREVCGDPVRIYRRLSHLCDNNVNGLLDKIRAASNEPVVEFERYQSEEKLLAAIQDAFKIAPFNIETGEGATDDVCWDALWSYIDWTQKKSLNGALKPTSPAPDSLPQSQSETPPNLMSGQSDSG